MNDTNRTPEFVSVEQGKNKSGKLFAIWRERNGTFGVWARCANYNGNVRGGVSYAWRYLERKLTEQDARTLYARRLKGTEK